MARGETDAFTERMFDAINGMLLDALAAISTGLVEISARARRQVILISPRENFSDSGFKTIHVV
jgi:hypothetical protein